MPGGLADRIAGYVGEAYKALPRRGAEAGGLLLGGVRLGPVIDIFITGFEAIPCDYRLGPSFMAAEDVLDAFRSAIARYPAPEILGYYRSHTRKNTGLDSSDQAMVDRIFPGLSGLVLLIKPSGIRFTAGYYFFQSGRLETRPVGPEFPFLVSVPGGTPPPGQPAVPAFAELVHESLDRIADPPHDALAPVNKESEPVPLAARPESTRRRRSLQWEIVAAGLMIVAALALLWWQYHGASGEEASAASETGPSHVASLGLAVHPGEGGWRITWDGHSASALDSVRGVLNVAEDESRERIPLTPEQVRAGAVTYRPIGDDITFRLDLVTRDNTLATETYRVLMRPHETEAASPRVRPAQPAKPPEPKVVKTVPNPAPKPESPPDEAYVESAVATRVAPEVPEGIRPRITTPVPIDVRVAIDREGRVTGATALQHEDGLIDFLAKRAVAAARQWTFTPAKRAGKAVNSTRTIHFVFEQ
jgi:hypothetical protein